MAVNKDMNIMEAVREYPVIADIFKKYNLGCIGCMVSAGETLGEGFSAHGLNADMLIDEINVLIAENK